MSAPPPPGSPHPTPRGPRPAAPPVRTPAWFPARAAVALWTVQGALLTLALAVVVAVLLVVLPEETPGAVRWVLPALVVVTAAVSLGVRPRLRYRVHRWEVTDEAVYTVTGWLSRTWTLVPIARIQTVDVTRSVVQQAFGLASVAVLTASSRGTVHVRHLDAAVAARVADDLARRAEAIRDVAT